MKICTILGTRPEIIKLSPLIQELEDDPEFEHKIIHTGQHYDYNMDKVFFEDLHLPAPNYSLNIGSHSSGKQTGMMLEKIETILLLEKPDLVIVQGDTNTTLSGALAASKLHLPLLHIEAGCRSFNREMPEEINRIITDHISNYCFAPDEKSIINLKREGVIDNKIFNVGSTAFDAALRNRKLVNVEQVLLENNLKKNEFVLVTIHRAENTDNILNLQNIIAALNELSNKITFLFAIHPRTKKILEANNLYLNENIKITGPQSYLSFLALLSSCRFCVSDSGGIQEEALVFNIPCLIPRNETEWTRLVDAGKNILMGTDKEKIVSIITKLLDDSELQKIKDIKYDYNMGVDKKIVNLIKEIKYNNISNDINIKTEDQRKIMIHPTADISNYASIGSNTKIWHQSQVREGAVIGDNCILAKNVYIDKDVKIGKNCKIQNNCSIYHGITIENGVFIGPHCVLTNDKFPRAINSDGSLKSDADWEESKILIREGASLGARVVVLPGITIGGYAMVGAGSVVTKDIPDFGLAYGNPAVVHGKVDKEGKKVV